MAERSLTLNLDGVRYSKDTAFVISNGNVELTAGDIAIFLGKNGIGKTTLLFSLCGGIQCLSRFRTAQLCGELVVDGKTVHPSKPRNCGDFWRKSGIIFQYPDHNFITTNVLDEFLLSARSANLDARQAFKKISELTRDYGIQHILHGNIDELSDGTKQLVALISSFIRSPSYLFFDEPTSLLDTSNKTKFIDTLMMYRSEHPECITAITTHEPAIFDKLSPNRVFVIDDGTLTEYESLDAATSVFHTGESVETEFSSPFLGKPILESDLLGSYYTQPRNPVFAALNISIKEGEIVTVTGKNGSGKTTLFKTLSTFHRKYNGRISYRGTDYRIRPPIQPSDLAYIPQVPSLQFSEDTVEKEIQSVHTALGTSFDFVHEIVRKAIEPFSVSLSDDPLSLSYGQQKLVSLLSFLNYPGVLLIDEPVICLDWTQRKSVFEILQHYANGGSTIMVATHSPELFASISTQEIQL